MAPSQLIRLGEKGGWRVSARRGWKKGERIIRGDAEYAAEKGGKKGKEAAPKSQEEGKKKMY